MTKKQLIMENALHLFAEQGFEATSIQQITEKSGISKGAFYLSFKSKEELILALIDHFLSEAFADFEHLVNSNPDTKNLLFSYFNQAFHTSKRHAPYGKLFFLEQKTSINTDIFKKIVAYNNSFYQLIHQLVVKQFPHLKTDQLADIVYFIQALTRSYNELFIFEECSGDVDIELVCHSLVEKVTLVAHHGKTPCISLQWLQSIKQHSLKLDQQQLIAFLQKAQLEVTDELIQQSISLLCTHVQQPTLPYAVEQGLLKNLREHPYSKWIAYIYEISNQP